MQVATLEAPLIEFFLNETLTTRSCELLALVVVLLIYKSWVFQEISKEL